MLLFILGACIANQYLIFLELVDILEESLFWTSIFWPSFFFLLFPPSHIPLSLRHVCVGECSGLPLGMLYKECLGWDLLNTKLEYGLYVSILSLNQGYAVLMLF